MQSGKLIFGLKLIILFFATNFAQAVTIQNFTYADPDNKKLSLTLFKGVNFSRRASPAVILIHGGSWIAGSRKSLKWYGVNFARAGYVAISIDYRLCPDVTFPKPIHDVKAAIRWLKKNAKKHSIDSNKIVLWGRSAGGHLAAVAASTVGVSGFEGSENLGYSSDVAAVISLFGPMDLTLPPQMSERPIFENFGNNLVEQFIGGASIEALRYGSPVSYFNEATPPTLFVHGDEDSIASPEGSREAFQILTQLKVPTKLIVLPDEGHSFDKFDKILKTKIFFSTLAFLKAIFLK